MERLLQNITIWEVLALMLAILAILVLSLPAPPTNQSCTDVCYPFDIEAITPKTCVCNRNLIIRERPLK